MDPHEEREWKTRNTRFDGRLQAQMWKWRRSKVEIRVHLRNSLTSNRKIPHNKITL